MNFDLLKMDFYQRMTNRLAEIEKKVPDLSNVDDHRKKIFALIKRIDKYFNTGKESSVLKPIQEIYELTKNDLPFLKFFKFDENIFDKKQKYSKELLDKCLQMYCEFIGCSRALYRNEEPKILFLFIKEFIKYQYVY